MLLIVCVSSCVAAYDIKVFKAMTEKERERERERERTRTSERNRKRIGGEEEGRDAVVFNS